VSTTTTFERGPEFVETKLAHICNDGGRDFVYTFVDGYLRVYYEKLGLKFQTYRDWLASGAQIPTRSRI
jgi:hypothetical protein